MSEPAMLFGEDVERSGHSLHVRSENERGGTDVWLTPPHILRALGDFDLDPCAAPEPRPWPTAREHLTHFENGLLRPWHGRVWCNPPYADMRPWLARLATHGDGVALIFARTDTATFHDICWQMADAMLFLRGRLNFCRRDGRPATANAGAPSVLIAYGERNVECLRGCELPGAFVDLRERCEVSA